MGNGSSKSTKLKILVRDVPKAKRLFKKYENDLIIEKLDFEDTSTFDSVSSVDKLLLIKPTRTSLSKFEQFVQKCEKANVLSVIFLTALEAQRSNDRMSWFAHQEAMISDRFQNLYIVRPGWFYENFSDWFLGMVEERHLTFPDGGAQIAFLSAHDIADTCIKLFAEEKSDGPPVHSVYNLSGPESLTHVEVAELFTKHLGVKVGASTLTDEQAIGNYSHYFGKTLDLRANYMMALMKDMQDQIMGEVIADMSDILERPLITFEEYIIDNKNLWNLKEL